MIKYDWAAQLKTCDNKIVELEQKIAAQKLKVRRLLASKTSAASAQRLLTLREESLVRVWRDKELIETRIAEAAAEQDAIDVADALSELFWQGGLGR